MFYLSSSWKNSLLLIYSFCGWLNWLFSHSKQIRQFYNFRIQTKEQSAEKHIRLVLWKVRHSDFNCPKGTNFLRGKKERRKWGLEKTNVEIIRIIKMVNATDGTENQHRAEEEWWPHSLRQSEQISKERVRYSQTTGMLCNNMQN